MNLDRSTLGLPITLQSHAETIQIKNSYNHYNIIIRCHKSVMFIINLLQAYCKFSEVPVTITKCTNLWKSPTGKYFKLNYYKQI